MAGTERPPSGPRGAIGAEAEEAATSHLANLGWVILGRNLRVDRDEIDILAEEPGERPTLVIVEVRSRSGPSFGSALESVDGRKVARLYRAAMSLRGGSSGRPRDPTWPASWRVDVLSLRRRNGTWTVDGHLRGVSPP